ncbi:MAG: helix-hairpin-helix domain-containing protein [Mucilaginibacter sp.]
MNSEVKSKAFKLNLFVAEKQSLKQNKIKINQLRDYAPDEIAKLFNADSRRANEIYGLISFQSIPSIGPRFAQDLISMGYFALDDLLEKNGHELFNELERKQGFFTDPCVEDQCLLAVHYANNRSSNKNGGILRMTGKLTGLKMVTRRKGRLARGLLQNSTICHC